MSCWGSQRSALPDESLQSTPGGDQFWNSGAMDFEYTGSGRLTVTGPLTGVVYRFSITTPRLRIHAADVASIFSVPALKPVR